MESFSELNLTYGYESGREITLSVFDMMMTTTTTDGK